MQFRADYRRMVNNEMAEYHTVYVDVVYIKTDLALQFVHLSPDNRDGQTYQNFTVQTFGKTSPLVSLHLRLLLRRKHSDQLYSGLRRRESTDQWN